MDYVKFNLININHYKLINHSVLDFKGSYSKSTGEINENVLVAEYHFCKITIKNAQSENPYILFTGSIHKLWNDLNGIKAPNYNEKEIYKGFNGNVFTLNNIIEIRSHLENLFDCKASQMIFQNIEFGVNINLTLNPKFFLKGLLHHRGIYFEFKHTRNYAQAKLKNWRFKIYNKKFQYKMIENILRVEVHSNKMTDIDSTGIKTFADINKNTLDKASDLLLKRFDETMHYDYSIDKKKLTKRELEAIKNYSNPSYWIEDLKPNHRDRHKTKLKEITNSHSKKIHQIIKVKIKEMCVTINQHF